MIRREDFEQLVIDELAKVPEQFHHQIKNVVFVVEEETTPETREENHLSSGQDLLGLYRGVPLIARGDNYGVGMTVPDVITIYQGPSERSAGSDLGALRRVVRETVFHEVAHYLGMNEGEVRHWEVLQS